LKTDGSLLVDSLIAHVLKFVRQILPHGDKVKLKSNA